MLLQEVMTFKPQTHLVPLGKLVPFVKIKSALDMMRDSGHLAANLRIQESGYPRVVVQIGMTQVSRPEHSFLICNGRLGINDVTLDTQESYDLLALLQFSNKLEHANLGNLDPLLYEQQLYVMVEFGQALRAALASLV